LNLIVHFRVKLDSFIRSKEASELKRLGYCSQNQPSRSLTQPLDDADDSLFDRIKMISEQVLQP